MAEYRGTCKKDAAPCYVFVRYEVNLHQRCKNTIWRQLSIHPSYTGKLVGIAQEVEIVEDANGVYQDCRPRQDKGVLILKFACQEEGQKWVDFTPEIKQKDWLDGVDIVMVEAKKPFDTCKPWLQVLDMKITDHDRFLHDYVVRANPYLEKVPATFGVVTSDKPKSMRGLWNPSNLILNQFASKEQFLDAYNSEEYKCLRELRQKTSQSKIILFELKEFK